MTTIIDTLKQEAAIKSSEYYEKLRKCGFPAPVPDFPRITPGAIKQYLASVARELAKNKKAWFPRFEVLNFYNGSGKYWGRGDDGFHIKYSYGSSRSSYAYVAWVESQIEETVAFPPTHVLNSIQRAKPLFNFIRIVTVEEVFDPLVVGINKNDQTRYLIDWWEKDIDPSQIQTT